MSTENRFNAIAANPVDRLIRGHQASLDYRQKVPEAGPARSAINALRREIDRLARGIDDHHPSSRMDSYISSMPDELEDSPPSDLASPPDPTRCPSTCKASDTLTIEKVMLAPDPPDIVITPLLMTNIGNIFDILM